MTFFPVQGIREERVLSRQIIFAIILALGIFLYFWAKLIDVQPEIFQTLPAAIFETIKEAVITQETFEEIPETFIPQEKTYLEIAEKGEGITHLARRALKQYLQESPQFFGLTPEHKIYIEDHIAKKMGGGWLKLGQELEISEDLLQESIEKAKNLSPEQLENLEQYSQLVPSLNY
ncbi:hypothetical protein AMJ50_00020 [Parcubacteria bacterium DG_74_3]|nr:MAG: hypothetical protein AMJ50_00020 [Parcubacteria bacterium DG_74_3]